MRSFLHEAIEYHKAGLKVIPLYEIQGKDTYPEGYGRYKKAQTLEDIERLFTPKAKAIILLVEDGLEVVDIDIKYDPKGTIADDLANLITEYGFDMPHVLQKTRSGGLHIIYRCPNPEGSQKMARRQGQTEAMIETKGLSGTCNLYPTENYEIISGSLLNIPTVTQDQRNNLISLCKFLDEKSEPEKFENNLKRTSQNLDGKSPWQAFDEAKDILQMMEDYGWKRVGMRGDHVRLNRPGAKNPKGVDASVILSKNIFFPFTSSTEFEPNKSYSPSSVFAILEHKKDFSAAARELYSKGFGDRITTKSAADVTRLTEVKKELPKLIELAAATKFDYFVKVQDVKPTLTYLGEKIMPIAGRGMCGVFIGHEKSGKSFCLSCVESSGVGNLDESLNLKLNLEGGNLLHFDTEQSLYFYQKTQKRIHDLAGIRGNTQNYTAYHLRRFSPLERLEIIEHFIYSTQNLSCVVIDGYVDLTEDYNSLEKSQIVVQRLLRWSDEKNCLILGVLHANKGDGKIRGHFGSEIKNKFDFVFNVAQREKNSYLLSNPTGRFPTIPDIEFTRDENGMPFYRKQREVPVFSDNPPPVQNAVPEWKPSAGMPTSRSEPPF
jgi:hypothetical protein